MRIASSPNRWMAACSMFRRSPPLATSSSRSAQSFPSAHTATAVGLALGLGSLYPQGRRYFAALAALAAETPLCVVLDLVLGSDATPLHTALTRRRLPVLLVSGADPSALPEVAHSRGWSYLAKPVDGGSARVA